ncbi:MAG: HAMP domain-containing sensor histidine kinase [Planctomycetota bacterium]
MSSPFFFARRLTVQLALALLVASVAPIAGAAFLVSDLLEKSLEKEARATQETLLAASRSLVEGHVRGAQSKLATISKIIVSEDFAVPREDAKADSKNREDLARRLSTLLEPSDTFLELAYYSYSNPQNRVASKDPGQKDENWQARAQAQQEAYGQNMRNNVQGANGNDQNLNNEKGLNYGNPVPASADSPPIPLTDPLVREPKGGKGHVSNSIQLAGPIPFIQISVPVGEGRPAGVLVASVSLELVKGMLTSVGGGKAEIEVADAAGVEIYGDGPATGADALLTRGAISALGWTISVRQPPSEAFATLTATRRRAWMWFGAAALFALLIAAFFTARILPPVRALTGAAERMARGDLTARANVKRDDELGRLARAFDEMAASLEKLDQMKSDFVSHVSHELRTPLTSMKLSVANLQDGILGPVGEKQLDVLGRCRHDLDRLIRMVNELLDEARLEAGKVELAKVQCDLAEIARSAVETVRPLADAKGVKIAVDTAPAPLAADRAKILEVVLNVVDNAVKFTPQGGAVGVRVAVRDGGVECQITDEGPGIPVEKASRIFERFAMIPAGGAPKPPGAGLGLSIARKIVELHQGTIRATNREGRPGAIFLIRLPPG